MPAPAEIVHVCRTAAKSPRLSVLTPFHKQDPTPLIERLTAHANVEFILLDDGSASPALVGGVIAAVERANLPAKVIVWENNRGRAAARNRLIGEARGEYVLFLDADMIPDQDDFLDRWLDLIVRQRPFIAFGGLSLQHVAPTRETTLHHFLFNRSDCRSAWLRSQAPAYSIASSNLLVRRDLLAEAPFDDGFSGWGWEDVEWGLRASRRAPILHVDIPATHAGLDCVETLLRKSVEAGPNYGRLARKHPEAMTRFPSNRIARLLKLVPLRKSLRDFCAWLARDPMGAAPLPLRSFALKTFRAAHCAEHLP
jgi:hypothetical protein